MSDVENVESLEYKPVADFVPEVQAATTTAPAPVSMKTPASHTAWRKVYRLLKVMGKYP
jgi:hypothetical protein